jgi:sphingomyelin phosphodiesterase
MGMLLFFSFCLGNHEGLPADQFDIFGDDSQWILDQLSEIWKPWLTPECKN